MANPNDGTQLGTAEVISDEYIDPTMQEVRRDPNLPPTAYKAPRSKIVVGPYGQDWGDASGDQPLAAESRNERQILELQSLRERDASMQQYERYGLESMTMSDSRGSHLSNRGSR